MSKHTPGPWYVVPRKCRRGNTVGYEVRAKNPNAKSNRGENILFVSPDSSTPSALANAHLIAAAPELLVAARWALAAEYGDPVPEMWDVCEGLSAAIAKARKGIQG